MKRHHSRHRSNGPNSADGIVVSCACGMEIAQSALERLEELDDTIFAALDGDADALNKSRDMWSDAVQKVGGPLLAESQAQYARHAREVWDASHSRPKQSLAHAFAALEVLGMVDE